MEQKILKRSKWKIPLLENLYYQSNFIVNFCKHNPEFIRELENDLFPLHLNIFGRHEKTTLSLWQYNQMLAVAIAKKDYGLFFVQVRNKLKIVYEVVGQASFSEENLRIKTDTLLDKINSIIKRHNLFFGSDDEDIPLWLAHWLLCQAEAGLPLKTPSAHIVYELPFKMLRELWGELPEIEVEIIMEMEKMYYKQQGNFHHYKYLFKSLDVFMEIVLFKTLPPPRMFNFREYK